MSKFAIKYVMPDRPSFYRHMTAIGPAFGGTEETTPLFDSKVEAQNLIDQFPIVAAVGTDIVEVNR